MIEPGGALARLAATTLAAVLLAGCAGGRPAVPGAGGSFPPIDGATLLVRGERANPDVSEDEIRALAGANAAFALELYRNLASGDSGNIVVGPHSISSALAMIYAGARGQTAEEMARVLHFADAGEVGRAFNGLDRTLESRSNEAVDLRLANQAFAQPGYGFLDAYLRVLSSDFGAPLAELDFSDAERARRVVNGWAADRTNQRIPELFPAGAITPLTRLVVANAVSLDAQWTYEFDPARTTVEEFHLPDGHAARVPMMHFDLYLPLAYSDDYAAVELPYGPGDLSMVVILPRDLAEFEAGLEPARLQQIFDSIEGDGIHLALPKFSFKSSPDMDAALRDMGMVSAYGDADFSGMTGGRDLFLDTVQHEAFIEIDEAGTEAQAATGGGMAVSHGPTIEFNRPFFFVIRDRPTGAILFLGRVADPRP